MAAPAVGDILVRTAQGWKRLPAGTLGYLLASGGPGVVPAWAASVPGSGGVPYMYSYSDAIDWIGNDNFRTGDGAGGMDLAGTRFAGAQAWTADNIGASVVTLAEGRLWLTSPASASMQIRGYYQPVPTGNWCVRMHLTAREMITRSTQYVVGMYLRDSTSGKEEFWGIAQAAGATVASLWIGQMTNNTTFSATRVILTLGTTFFPPFIEIEYDGTNYYCRAGFADGPLQRFGTTHSFGKTSFLTAAADGIGVFSCNNQSVAATLIARGFYRVPTSSVLV